MKWKISRNNRPNRKLCQLNKKMEMFEYKERYDGIIE